MVNNVSQNVLMVAEMGVALHQINVNAIQDTNKMKLEDVPTSATVRFHTCSL